MADDNENLHKKLDELLSKADHFFKEINEIRELIVKKESEEKSQTPPEPVITQKINVPPVETAPPVVVHPIIQLKQTYTPPARQQQFKSTKQQNNDIEQFIGENLFNKIGIVILVIGIGFFVKYAIDKNWINETARTLIGVLAGFMLIGFGYMLRKKYRAFSSVLCGGGISVLYFSIYIAFRQYELFSQSVAFAIFVIITALAILLSLWFDRKELAIIAIAGGFCSPLMASTGQGNYIVLFTYLLILNSGMLILAYRKKWDMINIICFGFTVIFYGAWLIANVLFNHTDPLMGAFVFGTAFFLLFFAMNIVNTLREKRKFGVFEIIMLSMNNFFYLLAGIAICSMYETYDLRGIFTALLGVFNLAFWFSLRKSPEVDKIFKYLLLGFGISFFSIAGPLELRDNFVTLFFAAEFVLLFWLAVRSELKLLFSFSAAVLMIVLMSLAINWGVFYNLYSTSEMPVIFNKAFLTSMFVIAAVFVNVFLNKKNNTNEGNGFFSKRIYNSILLGILIYLVYCSVQFELSFQLARYVEAESIRNLIVYSYVSSYFMMLMYFFRNNRKNYISVLLTVIALFITFLYPFTSHSNTVIIRNYSLYADAGSIWAFYYHYLNLALLAANLYIVYTVIKTRTHENPGWLTAFQWYACIATVFIVSTETTHISVLINYTSLGSIPVILEMTNKMAFSVVWGLTSFAFMVYGLKKNIRNLRIISLCLFSLTLIKLFAYDILDISAGGKIIAFICLGIILLTVSFLYQKLKKLVFGDADINREETPS
jgi:uncharacterized membrane protein